MAEAETLSQDETDAKETRERSDIGFPYMGLDEGIDVARAIFATTGSGACPYDNLAAALGFSMNSSGFRVRLSTAKMFGLIDGERGASAARLTDLGGKIVDPSQEKQAKVTAFLNVPLYRKLFELHRGRTLPPPAALARVMGELGVAKKQTDRARQTFDRSAASAGFFKSGRDKLIAPVVGVAPQPPVGGAWVDLTEGGGTLLGSVKGDGTPLRVPRSDPSASLPDPLMDALIKKLPGGPPWGVAERIAWLQMMSIAFTLAYGAADKEIEIKPKA